MLIALVALAYLQYNWLGSVSEGERARLEENLQASSENFASDYYRFFSDLSSNFQVRLLNSDDDIANALEQAYGKWESNSKYPNLIDSIYVLSELDGGKIEVALFDTPLKQLKAATTSKGIEDWLRETTGSNDKGHILSLRNQVYLGDPSFMPVPIQLLNLVMSDAGRRSLDSRPVKIDMTHLSKVVLLQLDDDVLKGEVIPSLARTYFSDSFDDQYYVQIKDTRGSEAPYYSSSTEIDENMKPDIKVSLNNFGFSRFLFLNVNNLDNLGGLSIRRDQSFSDITTKFRDTSAAAIAAQTFQQTISVIGTDITGINTFSDSTGSGYSYTTGTGSQGANLAFRSVRSSDSTFVGAFENNEPFQGQMAELWLTSKAGSLDNLVALTRTKNLGISFFILFILGISGGLIVVYSQRAQSLADQQMLFVAGVSHELRTPLSVIRSAAENMADGVVGTKEKQKEYAELMLKEGRRLSDMVDHIMEYSGIQAGKKVYNFMRVDARDYFEDLFDQMSSSLKDSGYSINHNIDPELQLIDIDQDAISLCVSNLVNNAVKFSNEPHGILIDVEPTQFNGNPAMSLSVTDEGIGISEEEQKQIFEPFFRGKTPLDEQIKGNGIGLSLVKKVSEAHKGLLRVKSTPGIGSTFTLVIPQVNDTV